MATSERQAKTDFEQIRQVLTGVAEEVSGTTRHSENDQDDDGLANDSEEDNGVSGQEENDFDYDGDEDDEDEDKSDDSDVEDTDNSADAAFFELPSARPKPTKGRQKIKPKKGSPLHKHLKYMHERLLDKDLRSNLEQGQTWFCPEVGASSMYTNSPTHDPEVFCCQSRCFIYAHVPHIQVPKLYGTGTLKKMACVFCEKTGHLESHIYDFRAAHTFGHSSDAWIFHRRVICDQSKGGCGKTIAEIDPRFLSRMDTRIVEQFPFITTVRGPAVHESLLHAYLELVFKSVPMGTFVSMYNSMKKLEYFKTTQSYYRHAVGWVRSRVDIPGARLPMAFPDFQSQKYNGFTLPLSLFKFITVRAIKQLEPYLQKTFQAWLDEGTSADHSFKYPKLIKNSIHGGKLFGAAYIILSQKGMITSNFLTMTKSNLELEPALRQDKEAREKNGVTVLKRLELDGGTDRYAWEKVHGKDLESDIEEYIPPPANDDLARATIESQDFVTVTSLHQAEIRIRDLLTTVNDSHLQQIVVGTDTENNMGINELRHPRTLALACPENIYKPVLLFHLDAMGVTQDPKSFPSILREFLQHPKLVHCGVNISHDHDGLQYFGVKLQRMFELSELAKQVDPNIGTSVEKLGTRFLKLSVDKMSQKYVDWSQNPLPIKLQRYAALDARLHLLLYWEITKCLEAAPCILRESADLTNNDCANFLHSNRVAAKVKILFVAGMRGGEARKWGKKKIPAKHALVRLLEVRRPNVKAPIAFEAAATDIAQGHQSWKGLKISDIFQTATPEIVVPMARLSKALQPIVQSVQGIQQSGNRNQQVAPAQSQLSQPPQINPPPFATNGQTTTQVPSGQTTAPVPCGQAEHSTEMNQQTSPPAASSRTKARTRGKRDLFHIFQDLPIALGEPGRNLIARLLILASCMFDADEYKEYAAFLKEKNNVNAEDLLDNFYFNREEWRQRVRTYRPEADQHGDRICQVHEFVATSIPTLYTAELKIYFDKFERLCREGAFEETNDVDSFIYAGKDANGLNLWYRTSGSTRAENVHQKQKRAVGPWAIGAKFAHYLLLWLDFRYNVNTGINRLNHHDFGMAHLYIIDEIQSMVMELYGIDPFPRHVNMSQFEGLEDYVAVGIRSLWEEDCEFVDIGEPDPALSGDLLFVAQRMGVRCPPVHMSTKEEWAIFKDFIRNKQQLRTQEWADLARIYKNRTNCETIFPKLPSMLSAQYDKWVSNLKIKELEQKLGPAYALLEKALAMPVDASIPGFGIRRQMEIPATFNESTTAMTGSVSNQPLPTVQFCAPAQQVPQETANQQKFRYCSKPGCRQNAFQCGGFTAAKCRNEAVAALSQEQILLIEKEKEQEKNKRKREVEMQRKKRVKKADTNESKD